VWMFKSRSLIFLIHFSELVQQLCVFENAYTTESS
jgi:hypothetical protein